MGEEVVKGVRTALKNTTGTPDRGREHWPFPHITIEKGKIGGAL